MNDNKTVDSHAGSADRNGLPFVSIIVLNYNGLRLGHLKVALDSLMKTNYPSFKITVVDNGSDDGSVNYILRHYPDVKVIPLTRNYGAAIALNIGILFSRGKYVAILNNDIEVDPNWLKPLVLVMEKFPEIGIADCKYHYFYDRKKFDTVSAAGRILDPILDVYAIGAGEIDYGQYDSTFQRMVGFAFFRREVLEKVKLDDHEYFDKSYFFGYEDVDLSLRVLLKGYKIVYVPLSIIYHKSSATISNPKTRKLREGIYYLAKKNQLKTIFKNYEATSILRYLPILIVDTLLLTIFFMLSRRRRYMREVISAFTRFLREIPVLKLKRSIIQGLIRKIGDRELRKQMLPYPTKFKVYYFKKKYWEALGLKCEEKP